MSHALKIFGRIADQRLREIVDITCNQWGFARNMSITEAIYAASLLAEKHNEKHKTVRAALLDLGKALYRAPHEVFWWSFQNTQRSRREYWLGQANKAILDVARWQTHSWLRAECIEASDGCNFARHRKTHSWGWPSADDTFLSAFTRQELEGKVRRLKVRLQQYDVRLKTKQMKSDPRANGSVSVDEPRRKLTDFNVCVKMVEVFGSLLRGRTARRQYLRIYRTVIRPAAMCGLKCWLMTKSGDACVSLMKTQMLQW